MTSEIISTTPDCEIENSRIVNTPRDIAHNMKCVKNLTSITAGIPKIIGRPTAQTESNIACPLINSIQI